MIQSDASKYLGNMLFQMNRNVFVLIYFVGLLCLSTSHLKDYRSFLAIFFLHTVFFIIKNTSKNTLCWNSFTFVKLLYTISILKFNNKKIGKYNNTIQ